MGAKASFLAVILAAFYSCHWNSARPTLLAQDGNSLLKRFQQEGPRGWQQYLARTKRLQGSFKSLGVEVAPNRRTNEDLQYEFKQRPGCALLMQQTVNNPSHRKGPPSGWLWAYNNLYGFALHRNKPDAPWAVSDVQLDLSKGVTIGAGGSKPSAQTYLDSPVDTNYVYGASLLELIVNPDFTATRASAVSRGGGTLVKVEFTVSQPTSKDPGVLKSGWFLLDPDFFWVQRDNEIQVQWRGKGDLRDEFTVATTFDYDERAAPFPILKRWAEQRTTKKANGDTEKHEWTFTFDLVEADVPESDFTLSAFGFPEPPRVSGPVRWYLWVAIGRIGFFALALLIWGSRRRRATCAAGK